MNSSRAHCNSCSQTTTHDVLFKKRQRDDWKDDEGQSYGYELEDFELLECRGCHQIKLKVASSSSAYDEYVTYYPPAMSRKQPQWASSMALEGIMNPAVANICDLLGEVYKALQNRMPRLAAMGVRALIEAVMVHQNADQGSFSENLKSLQSAGHLSLRDKTRLELVLDAGSAAIHRGYAPTEKEVVAMVDIAEHLMASVYVNDGRAATASERVPPRPPRLQKFPKNP